MESTEVSLRRIRKGTSHTAQLNRMDQAYKNLLVSYAFKGHYRFHELKKLSSRL